MKAIGVARIVETCAQIADAVDAPGAARVAEVLRAYACGHAVASRGALTSDVAKRIDAEARVVKAARELVYFLESNTRGSTFDRALEALARAVHEVEE